MTRDWKRLRTRIQSLSDSRRQFSAIAWAAVGAAISAFFAALAWYPTYSALGKAQQLDYSWIGPVTIVIGLASGVIAALMFFAARKAQGSVETTVVEILADMDDMPPTPVL